MFLKKHLTRTRKIMLGFLAIILVGACLLMLPFATVKGQSTTFLNALFTAVSATCVTGLVAYDTFSHWTLFGQIVILFMIQIGGLGFITISTYAMMRMNKKIGISQRALIQDSLSTMQIRGSVRLVRRIILGTILFEGIGAILLSLRFMRDFGFLRAIWFGIFHSISAFCNAGFDLMGFRSQYSSFTLYYDDAFVIGVLSALIIIGGLGFVVWEDFWTHRHHYKKYSVQTKLVLWTTGLLLVGSTVLFYLFESNQSMIDMNGMQKFLASWFSAVTPRTAGFNSIDTAGLSNSSLFLTMILMVIGGSPGSTAGGIKTITFAIIVLHLKSYIFHERDINLFKRRIQEDAVQKASIVVFIYMALAIAGILVICGLQPELAIRDVGFEVFSAIGTSGMSTGVTRALNSGSRVMVMLLMFSGRMGSLTFAMSFTERRKTGKIRYPEVSVPIG